MYRLPSCVLGSRECVYFVQDNFAEKALMSNGE